MRQNDLQRAVAMLLQRVGRKQRPLVIGILVVAAIGYVFVGPVLEKRCGWSLPGLDAPSSPSSTANPTANSSADTSTNTAISSGEQTILDAFRQRKSDVIVSGTATVKKLLPDDKVGDRHQKMILRLPSGHSLLLAHNIDLADRVPADEGDRIEFTGEYEYSEQGGVLHWTHHDPRGRHHGGWIKLNGTKYE